MADTMLLMKRYMKTPIKLKETNPPKQLLTSAYSLARRVAGAVNISKEVKNVRTFCIKIFFVMEIRLK